MFWGRVDPYSFKDGLAVVNASQSTRDVAKHRCGFFLYTNRGMVVTYMYKSTIYSGPKGAHTIGAIEASDKKSIGTDESEV